MISILVNKVEHPIPLIIVELIIVSKDANDHFLFTRIKFDVLIIQDIKQLLSQSRHRLISTSRIGFGALFYDGAKGTSNTQLRMRNAPNPSTKYVVKDRTK